MAVASKPKPSGIDGKSLLKLKVGQMVLAESLLPTVSDHEVAMLVEQIDDDAKPGCRKLTIGIFWYDIRVNTMTLFVEVPAKEAA